MRMRRLGSSSLQVSALCFGGNVFGWTADESMSFKLLDALAEAGCNFIDTADVYSRWVPGHAGGESETIIGKWLKASAKRDRVVLATKVGMDMGPGRKGLSPTWIRSAWPSWTSAWRSGPESSARCTRIGCVRSISIYRPRRADVRCMPMTPRPPSCCCTPSRTC